MFNYPHSDVAEGQSDVAESRSDVAASQSDLAASHSDVAASHSGHISGQSFNNKTDIVTFKNQTLVNRCLN